jgi:HAD superfamily hydrolase (TIGR01509 family)
LRSYELVIFDCDGVLVDSEPIANRVLTAQLHAVGLRIAETEVMAKFVGRTRAGCLELATQLLGRPLPADFAQTWDSALFQALASEVRATDGVREILETLDIPYCVASNGESDRVQLTLKAADLLALFEGRIFSSSQVARPKPAPDLFLHAAQAMNVAPSRSVVIEDTVTGVRAGVAAGMTVLAYAVDPAQHAAMRALGAIPFDAMRKLRDLLREIPQGTR